MKKTFIFMLIFYFLILGVPQKAYALNTHFARVRQTGVYLYRTANLNTNFSNLYFEIPNTYFVELMSDHNENFYKAKYLDQIGYVKKSDVSPITSTPTTVNAVATFRVFSSDGAHLRTEPTTVNGSSSIVTALPTNTSSLEYFGKIEGQEAISGRGNIWYYCKFINGNSFYGYVYAGLCDMLSPITPNTETVQYTTNPYVDLGSSEYLKYLQTDENLKIILITAVTVPALIIFYFLFVPIKSKVIVPQNPPAAPKKSKKQKEYLFDDKEL